MLIVVAILFRPGTSAGARVWNPGAGSQPTMAAMDSSWWTPWIPSAPPPYRAGFSYVFDPVRNRMILFGGVAPGAVFQNDTWALSLSDPPAWGELTPSGGPPPGRSLDSAIYDPVRDRMIIFGGAGANTGLNHYLNDVWALDLSGTPQWTQILASGGPSSRGLHSAIYDPMNDRMLVYGGLDGFSSLGDLWALSLSGTPAWAQLTPSGMGPSTRYAHRAIYDPILNSMMMFGGVLFTTFPTFSSTNLNDTWSLSLSGSPAWSQVSPPDPLPSARNGMSMVYDSARDRVLVCGGADSTGALSDAWALSLSGSPAWTQAAPAGDVPPARTEHAAVYEPSSDQMVIFGGFAGATHLSDTWAFHWCVPCGTTAVSVFLDGADASQGVVHLRWTVPGGDAFLVGIVQRRGEGSDWADLTGPLSVDAPEFRYEDPSVEAGKRYAYRLRLRDDSEEWFTSEAWVQVPSSSAAPRIPVLDVPYPNPTGGSMTFRVGIPGEGSAHLRIYDVAGRRITSIFEGDQAAGWTTRVWGGEDSRGRRVSTGVYIAVLETRGQMVRRKILVTR
jgi:hypothetical protein